MVLTMVPRRWSGVYNFAEAMALTWRRGVNNYNDNIEGCGQRGVEGLERSTMEWMIDGMGMRPWIDDDNNRSNRAIVAYIMNIKKNSRHTFLFN